MALYYEPKEGRCGDFIPFYWQGLWHLFYLKGAPWHHVSTPGLIHSGNPSGRRPYSIRTSARICFASATGGT